MRVTLQPSGAVLEIQPGERILDGARRLGYDCPQSCRNGNCHVCAALLVEGRVEQAGKVHDHGEFYTCIAASLEDCVLLWDGVLALGELPVRSLSCQVIVCREVGGDTWRAREAGRILGFLCLDGEDLDQLYLLPGEFRRGIGSLLLAKAKELSPERLHLFTFQRNAAARAFYERHGFRLVDLNDGERNEEGEPDALYEWRSSFSNGGL